MGTKDQKGNFVCTYVQKEATTEYLELLWRELKLKASKRGSGWRNRGPVVTKEDLAYAGSHVNWSSFKDQEAEEAELRNGACFYLFQLQNSHITSQSTVSSFSHPSFSLLSFGIFRYIDWDFQFMSVSGMDHDTLFSYLT
ncbi:hypothetical protein R1flu_013506 [Riccia fluitans]|uniref:Uncharacterized protein n=1 Tax=Riccia fluitans TaxID=41844 RepID=A0ABD1YDQ7_9MARC